MGKAPVGRFYRSTGGQVIPRDKVHIFISRGRWWAIKPAGIEMRVIRDASRFVRRLNRKQMEVAGHGI